MKVYIGSDHRGFYLKEHIKPWLAHWGYEFEDVGAIILDPDDDYTNYARVVALKVQDDKKARGILLCGSGVGVEIVANKFDGVRAGIGKTADQVKAGRHDDDMNVLVLASDFTKENEAKNMIEVFLKENSGNAKRFKKRLDDIKKIEDNN